MTTPSDKPRRTAQTVAHGVTPCTKRVAARYTPGLKVPCARRAVVTTPTGRALCLQHALARSEVQRRQTLRRAERDLLEYVVAMNAVPKELRTQVLSLRRDAARWADEDEVSK